MTPTMLERYVSTSRRRLRLLTASQYVGGSAGLLASVRVAATVDGHLMRIGAVLMALLFAFVLVLMYRAPRARDVGSAIADPFIESYRAELQRHRWLFSGYRLWSRLVFGIPVAAVVCLGLARSNPALTRFVYLEFAAIVVGLSITCVIAHRRARRYQQEIEELDALGR
jgi:Ca2+/Na+ antiporter